MPALIKAPHGNATTFRQIDDDVASRDLMIGISDLNSGHAAHSGQTGLGPERRMPDQTLISFTVSQQAATLAVGLWRWVVGEGFGKHESPEPHSLFSARLGSFVCSLAVGQSSGPYVCVP